AKIRSASVIVAPADAVGAAPMRGPDGWPTIPGARHNMQLGDQSASVTITLNGSGTNRYWIQPVYSNGETDEVRAQPFERVISFFPRSKSPAISSTNRPSSGVSSTTRPPGVSSTTPVRPGRPAEVGKAYETPKPSGKAQPVGEIRTKAVQ